MLVYGNFQPFWNANDHGNNYSGQNVPPKCPFIEVNTSMGIVIIDRIPVIKMHKTYKQYFCSTLHIYATHVHVKENILEQNLNKTRSQLNCASFGTFCFPIGQSLCQARTFSNLHVLIAARTIDRFEH